ncbi:hypothetical protein GALMADRAFT_723185 [Galerina marginata CBS 339.88]|uniref:TPR-like protein n=1 Tax=Galerina marginata (strain CBS 339.88) TaxID=685588 RepID=A0A067SZQ4_GALM3|nr:hypothetical protein GALMADRAFT_723185 [Galerina marginata CBS 339.88]
MADSLSVVSARTLATVLEEITSVAQTLERLFIRASENLQDTHSLAAEIVQTVKQLKDFCDEHYDVCDSSDDMKRALFDLVRDLKLVYTECRDLLVAPAEGKVRKLKVTLGARRNRSKIESDVLELRNRVSKCHTQVMMFALMNTESQLVPMDNSGSQILTIIEREIARMQIPDDRLIAFLGTSSAMLSTLPRELSLNIISDTYLRLQIDAIDEYLVELSSAGSYPVEEPMDAYLQPYQPVVVSLGTQDTNTLRQDIIAKTVEIQEFLRNDSSTLSVQTGAWEMVNLSIGLFSLEMYQEAATMGLWTVNLFRTLVATNSAIYSPYLAHSLRHLARYYSEISDFDGARSAIQECITISRRLHNSSTDLELKGQIVPVLTMSAYLASRRGENNRALEDAEEAVRIFEGMIQENRRSYESSIQLIRTEQEWAQALANFSDKAVCDYSRALQQLSNSFQDAGRLAEAINAQQKATTIMAFISRYYPEGTLEPELADMYFRLSHQDFHDVVPLDEALGYAQQAVEVYRKLAEKDSKKHSKSLCHALWEQANILGKQTRYDEALAVWKEIAALARDIMADQLFHANALEQVSWSLRRLKRHDEAASTRAETVKVYNTVLKTTSVTEADTYYDLAVDLQLALRYTEAVRAAQMAVTQYRALAFADPAKYTKNVAKGLNCLTGILIHANEQEQAFNEGHEALKLYESLIRDDSGVLSEYTRCLSLNSFLGVVSSNENKSIERIQDVIRHSRELIKQFPPTAEEESLLIRAIINYSRILTNFNRLPEASVVVQEALVWYDENAATSHKAVFQHMDCLIEIGSLLDHQGFTEKALVPIQKAVDVGKPFSSNPPVASMVAGSMHRCAQLFLEMGRYAEGVVASEEAVAFAREATLENISEFIGCLQVASIAYKYTGQAQKAIDAITEALELCRSEAIAELAKTRVLLLLYLPQCLQYLSSSIAAAGREADALPLAQESVDEALKLKNKLATLSWSDIEPTYMSALSNLATRLAANDDLPRALELTVQCRTYYEGRSQTRNGAYTALACVLVAEGILHCASGRHEEGLAAKAKLEEMQKRLETDFPSLARLVEIELDGEKNLASWIALVAKLDLQCHHQD